MQSSETQPEAPKDGTSAEASVDRPPELHPSISVENNQREWLPPLPIPPFIPPRGFTDQSLDNEQDVISPTHEMGISEKTANPESSSRATYNEWLSPLPIAPFMPPHGFTDQSLENDQDVMSPTHEMGISENTANPESSSRAYNDINRGLVVSTNNCQHEAAGITEKYGTNTEDVNNPDPNVSDIPLNCLNENENNSERDIGDASRSPHHTSVSEKTNSPGSSSGAIPNKIKRSFFFFLEKFEARCRQEAVGIFEKVGTDIEGVNKRYLINSFCNEILLGVWWGLSKASRKSYEDLEEAERRKILEEVERRKILEEAERRKMRPSKASKKRKR